MFRIRPGQIDAFGALLQSSFESRMLTHLRDRFPGHPALRTFDEGTIRSNQARARSYGIADEFDFRRYLEHVVDRWPEFETLPWVREILQGSLSGHEKVNAIDELGLFHRKARVVV